MTSIKPTVTKLRNITGRKILGYKATIGSVEARGNTEREASEACVARALDTLADMSTTVLWSLYPDDGGHLTCWILVPNGHGGWEYRIARPMRPGQHFDALSACSMAGDRATVLSAMREHWFAVNVEPFCAMLRALAGR
jgi:hypothetical protein